MTALLGNKMSKYTHFSLVIKNTGLQKIVHKGKTRKTMVTEHNQCFTIAGF